MCEVYCATVRSPTCVSGVLAISRVDWEAPVLLTRQRNDRLKPFIDWLCISKGAVCEGESAVCEGECGCVRERVWCVRESVVCEGESAVCEGESAVCEGESMVCEGECGV